MELPEKFVKRMKEILGDGYCDFINAYGESPVRALRVNTLKISKEEFEESATFPIQKIPFIDDGYYFECDHIGDTPFHRSGAIYVQEPAAMAVIESVDIEDSFNILDVCAAPGGKSTQACMKNYNAITVSNEIVFPRTQILMQNIERLGISHSVITSTDSKTLAARFPACFDLTVVDAPCSGEGMMRKNDLAISEWSEENVLMCAKRQKEILEESAKTVKNGGFLLYSTCTFSLEENEMTVDGFLASHPDFEIVRVNEKIEKVSKDGIEFEGAKSKNLSYCRRFYPHVFKGEGQFVALMKRMCGDAFEIKEDKKQKIGKSEAEEEKTVKEFIYSVIPDFDFDLVFHKDGWYAVKSPYIDSFGVFSPGVKVGTIQKGRVIPSHRFFTAFGDRFANKAELADTPMLDAYLRGETFPCTLLPGYAVATYHGVTLGGIKVADGVAKNFYPKGLRR